MITSMLDDIYFNESYCRTLLETIHEINEYNPTNTSIQASQIRRRYRKKFLSNVSSGYHYIVDDEELYNALAQCMSINLDIATMNNTIIQFINNTNDQAKADAVFLLFSIALYKFLLNKNKTDYITAYTEYIDNIEFIIDRFINSKRR